MNTSLFGGAIASAVPSEYTDVSTLRQVPDNQEAFAHAETDRSLVFELLQAEQDVMASEAAPAKYHWHILARDSAAVESDLSYAQDLPLSSCPSVVREEPNAHISIAYGMQRIAKYKDTDDKANVVRVCLACIRLPRVSTDVLIVFNDPVVLHPDSASTKLGSATGEGSQRTSNSSVPEVENALSSFTVKDWSLFD